MDSIRSQLGTHCSYFQEKLINNSLLSELDLYLLVEILMIDVLIPFTGIYRVNEIPDSFFHYPGSTYVIINLDTEGMGTHWTVLMKDKNNYYYNDSFGMGLPDILLDNIKEKDGTVFQQNHNDRCLFWSNIQRQPIDSNRCGWYCLLFVIHMMMISHSDDISAPSNNLEESYKILDHSWLIGSSEDSIEKEMIKNFMEYLDLSCKIPE